MEGRSRSDKKLKICSSTSRFKLSAVIIFYRRLRRSGRKVRVFGFMLHGSLASFGSITWTETPWALSVFPGGYIPLINVSTRYPSC